MKMRTALRCAAALSLAGAAAAFNPCAGLGNVSLCITAGCCTPDGVAPCVVTAPSDDDTHGHDFSLSMASVGYCQAVTPGVGLALSIAQGSGSSAQLMAESCATYAGVMPQGRPYYVMGVAASSLTPGGYGGFLDVQALCPAMPTCSNGYTVCTNTAGCCHVAAETGGTCVAQGGGGFTLGFQPSVSPCNELAAGLSTGQITVAAVAHASINAAVCAPRGLDGAWRGFWALPALRWTQVGNVTCA